MKPLACTPDPTRLFEVARSECPSGELELYLRFVSVRRVTMVNGGPTIETSLGVDRGTALRSIVTDRSVRFAASSGAGARSVRRAARDLSSSPAVDGPPTAPPREMEDLDPPAGEIDLESTLSEVVERVRARAVASGHDAHIDHAWLEQGSSFEWILNSGGGRWLRGRARCWATVGIGTALLRAAARDVADLGSEALVDQVPPPIKCIADRSPHAGTLLELPPERAAALLRVLSPRAIPGCRVLSAPSRKGSIWGGTFDDCGFPAGNLRRGSYRDPPAPSLDSLVVEPADAGLSRGDLWVSRLGVHPMGGEWFLDVDAIGVSGSQEGVFVRNVAIADSPERLRRRIVGTAGVPAETTLGVRTPALLLEL